MSSIILYTIVTSILYLLGGLTAYNLTKDKNKKSRPDVIIMCFTISMWGIYSLLIYLNST